MPCKVTAAHRALHAAADLEGYNAIGHAEAVDVARALGDRITDDPKVSRVAEGIHEGRFCLCAVKTRSLGIPLSGKQRGGRARGGRGETNIIFER